MLIVELEGDDFDKSEGFVRIGRLCSAIAKAKGAENIQNTERKLFPRINAGVQLGKLNPLDPETLEPLSKNDYGLGIVPFAELVEWGCATKLFDFKKAKEVPQTARAEKAEDVKGITKQLVINAFEGMHFDRDHWGRNLATPPDWLKECRVAKGNKKTSATWNPVLIAMALTDPKRGISVNKLDVVFVGLKDWADEWREASDYLR